MKSVITLFALCFSLTALAKSEYIDTELTTCQQEAQIIAKVSAINKVSQTSCLVQVNEVRQYNASLICPLEIAAVNQGIEVGMKTVQECALQIGYVLSGIISKNKAGVIVLE